MVVNSNEQYISFILVNLIQTLLLSLNLIQTLLMLLHLFYTEKVSLNPIQTSWVYYKVHSKVSKDELQIGSIDDKKKNKTMGS